MKKLKKNFMLFVTFFFIINFSIYTHSETSLKKDKHSSGTVHTKERILLKSELKSYKLDKNTKKNDNVNSKINSESLSITNLDKNKKLETITELEKTSQHLREISSDKTFANNSLSLNNELNPEISDENNSKMIKISKTHQTNKTAKSSNNRQNLADNNHFQASRKFETNIKDYFQTTSKNDQNIAWQALSGFLGGFILWYVSICLTCWSERRAVRVAELADHINDESKVEYIDDGNYLPIDKHNKNKAYMVNGKLILNREAQIEGSNLKISSDLGKILILKLKIDKFSKSTVIEEKEGVKDMCGNTMTEVREKTYKNWIEVREGEDSGIVSKYFYGDSLISGNYKFDCSKLQNVFIVKENVAIYEFTDADSSALEAYLRKHFTNANFFIRSNFLFVITSNTNVSDNQFEPENFIFTNDDYKISLFYYYLPRDFDTYFTAIGSLSNTKEVGIWEFGPFESNIPNAEFCHLCCFCEDSSYMKIDVVLTKRMTRQKYYEEMSRQNNSMTWCLRIVCFFLHFISYYLLLYPLIIILGMIPFLGAIGAKLLIFVAFLISIITFLIVVAVAWIFARPLRAFIIFALVGIFIFIGKSSSDELKAQYNSSHSNSRILGLSYGNTKFL